MNNGSGNIYSDVDHLTLNGIVTAPSAGKFFHSNVKEKFESEKLPAPLISLVLDGDGSDECEDHEEGYIADNEIDW